MTTGEDAARMPVIVAAICLVVLLMRATALLVARLGLAMRHKSKNTEH